MNSGTNDRNHCVTNIKTNKNNGADCRQIMGALNNKTVMKYSHELKLL